MKSAFAAAALAVVLVAGPALAADSMAITYGNTLSAKGTDGAVTNYHFKNDGTYHAVLPGAKEEVGIWTVASNKLCITPKGATAAQCGSALAGQKLGDSWEATDDAGNKFTLSLLEGIK